MIRDKSGFSLMEVLIVMAILAIAGSAYVSSARQDAILANASTVGQKMQIIAAAAKQFRAVNREWPRYNYTLPKVLQTSSGNTFTVTAAINTALLASKKPEIDLLIRTGFLPGGFDSTNIFIPSTVSGQNVSGLTVYMRNVSMQLLCPEALTTSSYGILYQKLNGSPLPALVGTYEGSHLPCYTLALINGDGTSASVAFNVVKKFNSELLPATSNTGFDPIIDGVGEYQEVVSASLPPGQESLSLAFVKKSGDEMSGDLDFRTSLNGSLRPTLRVTTTADAAAIDRSGDSLTISATDSASVKESAVDIADNGVVLKHSGTITRNALDIRSTSMANKKLNDNTEANIVAGDIITRKAAFGNYVEIESVHGRITASKIKEVNTAHPIGVGQVEYCTTSTATALGGITNTNCVLKYPRISSGATIYGYLPKWDSGTGKTFAVKKTDISLSAGRIRSASFVEYPKCYLYNPKYQSMDSAVTVSTNTAALTAAIPLTARKYYSAKIQIQPIVLSSSGGRVSVFAVHGRNGTKYGWYIVAFKGYATDGLASPPFTVGWGQRTKFVEPGVGLTYVSMNVPTPSDDIEVSYSTYCMKTNCKSGTTNIFKQDKYIINLFGLNISGSTSIPAPANTPAHYQNQYRSCFSNVAAEGSTLLAAPTATQKVVYSADERVIPNK